MFNWLPDDPAGALLLVAALVALSNLALVALLVFVAFRGRRTAAHARRAVRKLLIAKRRAKGLQYALNVTVNQFHALRRKAERRPRAVAAGTPPLVPAPQPRFIAPPPLPALASAGEDPASWADSGIVTCLQRDPATQTQSIPVSQDLLRQTRPPR